MATLVKAHYRNKDDEQADRTLNSAIVTGIVLLASIVLMAIIFWKVTLVLVATGLLITAGREAIKRRADRLANGVIVNMLGKRRIV